MKRLAGIFGLFLSLVLLAGLSYGAFGYYDASRKAPEYSAQAQELIENGFGAHALGAERLQQLLMVQDPRYFEHGGVDLWTKGAGLTTISQSLAKRLGFEEFRPGIGKIRQTGFALGLERHLNKDYILALWLDSVEMGRGPAGWMVGFFNASEMIYHRPPEKLSDAEFYRLLAVLIAPAKFRLLEQDSALEERSSRIFKLLNAECAPTGLTDVWLESCA